MSNLSAEDKGKGKRIITQFFRTMPGVQKSLLNVFEKDGYEGVSRIQAMLYPGNSQDINSTDSLRKGLSMVLQHIYGMPVEDKEGYFQEILKCKTASQVVRKEKETLVHYFCRDFPELKDYLSHAIIRDNDYSFVNMLIERFVGEEETSVSDMRSFKNQLRNVSEALADQVESGTSEEQLITIIKEHKEEYDAKRAEESAAIPEVPEGVDIPAGEAEQKKQIIVNTLNDEKYQAVRDLLIQKTVIDPDFATMQQYLDNILSASSPRLIANDMETFTAGVKKIKEFRDNVEKELV